MVRLVNGGLKTRYAAPDDAGRLPELAEGWQLERLTAPSRLLGANGLRTGPDGRIYIAQVTGSQISALNLATATSKPTAPRAVTSSRPTTSRSTREAIFSPPR